MSDKKIIESEYNNIINLYNNGFTQQKISDIYGVSIATISKILKKNNIKCSNVKIKECEHNDIINLYLDGKSLLQIADLYHVCDGTIVNILKKYNIDRRPPEVTSRKYYFDEHYFDKIDTPNKAYILGLLYADGCNYSRHNGIKLELQDRDKDILEKINKELKNTKPLKFYERSKTSVGRRDTYAIELFSKNFADTLSNKGVVPRKSLILTFPEWLDDDLYYSFLRGYSDGDGCISKDISRASWSIVSTNEFCLSVAKILECKVGIDKYTIYTPTNTTQNTVTLHVFGRNRVKMVLDWIYQDAELFIQRKYDIYKSLYSDIT